MVTSERIAGNNNNLTKTTHFDALGICCSSEASLIEKIVKPLEGVVEVSVVIPTKTVVVVHHSLLISEQQIERAINKGGFEASVRVNGVKNNNAEKWPSPHSICCGVLLLLSLLTYVYEPLKWLAVGAAAVGSIPIFLRALKSLLNLTLDINILMLIAVIGSIALQDYWEAATIAFLFTIAEWLESRATHQAVAVLSSLVDVVPQRAVLAETGEELNADKVELNTLLSVKTGEMVPIDGIVVDGECEVDEKTLTGEPFPVAKQKDSTVWAGTINLNGYINIKTTAVAKDCVVARMAKLVEDAQNNKSKTQRYIDKIAKYYTPVIVAISACLAIVPASLRLENRNEWYRLALVTLVTACPCALVLSTPIAMFCALSKAATLGLLFKGAEYLETLAKIKVMAFDKTGTVTRGQFTVTRFKTFMDGVSHNTLLYWVSSIESKSSHPMATAVIDYAYSHSVEAMAERVEQFQNFPGEGIYGRIDGREIYIGNKKISSRAGCTTVPELCEDTIEGKSMSYVFVGSSPAGCFSLSDVCRGGVREALEELNSMGIQTVMLTGDSYTAANHAQDQLGGAFGAFHAELLPEEKARYIRGFQKEAATAMIGDGVNDAPALATADIGISMGVSGSALAMETGHIILMTNDVGRIPIALRLARRAGRKIIENMVLSITMKAGVLALAVAGYPLVWAAVVSDVGSCLIVIFNSMLLLQGSRSSTSGPLNSCKSSHSCQQPCCPSTDLQNTCDNSICESTTSDLEEPLLTSQNHCHANHSTNHCNSLNKDDNKGTKPCCESQRIDQVCSPEFITTTGNVECAAIDDACSKARQVGCCQSFRKECCSKSSKFGGSLSEIVIE
ncbi:PREDICTED: putative inactive cadmium/zinc-transporting ATPase HMA3 [Ipomoea nil]|uniref:putative inactive cadmium/zinc-transporting ATPase HMA3 n=1 Tax=Ipomoea nil TaxID=35883 RepID=UPI000900D9F8|nr:PREDICTED: putative inactive cadmium/zinc-transporting ATPase HMA3 [Ipomoea nil]